MTTISATVNPDRASVSLAVVPTGPITSVLRHDSNGIQPVRFPAGTFPTSRALRVDDWEAALAGTVTYRVGGAESATDSVVLDGTGPWLTPPLVPSAAVPLVTVLEYDGARTSSTSVNELAGGGSTVKMGTLGYRSGTFTVLVADSGVAAHLEDLLGRYPQQMLRLPERDSLDLYFITRGTKISLDNDTGRWTLDVEYTETGAPSSSLPTWTYDSLAAAYGTLATAAEFFPTLDALARNDRRV